MAKVKKFPLYFYWSGRKRGTRTRESKHKRPPQRRDRLSRSKAAFFNGASRKKVYVLVRKMKNTKGRRILGIGDTCGDLNKVGHLGKFLAYFFFSKRGKKPRIWCVRFQCAVFFLKNPELEKNEKFI